MTDPKQVDGDNGGPRNPDDPDSMHDVLASTYEGREPGGELEARVMADFEAARPRTRSGVRRLLPLAAAATVVFFLGFGAGRLPQSENPGPTGRYMMILFDGPESATRSEEAEQIVVQQYVDWAQTEAGTGRDVLGERLLSETEWVMPVGVEPPTGTPERTIGGFFIIGADSMDEAVEVAENHPHRARGGWIQVRPIG